MDSRLVGWGRAVKQRLRHGANGAGAMRGGGAHGMPVLWLFTDAARLADPLGAAAALPRGLCGVVLRDDAMPGRAVLARALAQVCRARRNALVVAGDVRLAWAVGAGVHLRGGRALRGTRGLRGLVTSSAHSAAELRRAARAGAQVAFLSPAFATASHPGASGLGAVRWSGLAQRVRAAGAGNGPVGTMVVGALGGIDGGSVRRLARLRCAAAIGALAP